MIVTMFRWLATLFLAPLGSSEGHSNELHCQLVWLGMFARDFLVTNNGFIYLGPGSASLGSFVDDVPCLYTQDPVAQCLIHRCELQFRCVFRSVLSRLDRVSDVVSLPDLFTVPPCSSPAELRWKWGIFEGTHGWMPAICWKRLSVPCISRKSVHM